MRRKNENKSNEVAKKVANAALDKIETWTGKDLDGDDHVGAEKPANKS